MPPATPQRFAAVWLIAALLAFAALALGAWDFFVERDGGENWITQAVLPLAIFAYTLWMYWRARKNPPVV
jgi:hypothetical protein